MFNNIRLSKTQKQFCKFFCAVVVVLVIALAVDFTRSGGSHYTPTLKLVIVGRLHSETFAIRSLGTTSSQVLIVCCVTRHGTRNPLKGYPNDPYASEKYWPDGMQALTSLGKMQLYNVGTTLRQLYSGFLNTHYLPSEFKAFSTLVERTLQSAGSLLAGLYPPKDYQLWNANIDWQPVPVYPNYLDKQDLPPAPQSCKHFWKLQNESLKLYEDKSNETMKVFQIINANTGMNITGIEDNFIFFWDALSSEDSLGMKLPEWTKEIYPLPLNSIVSRQLTAFLVGSEGMIRLLAGPMLASFVDSMKKKLNNTGNDKYHMLYYSSHDHTLKGLLASFGFQNIPIINFAHTLLLELHSHPLLPSGHEVKLFQIDGSSSDRSPRGFDIPNCTSSCDFNQFLQLTKKYYEGLDWKKECEQ